MSGFASVDVNEMPTPNRYYSISYFVWEAVLNYVFFSAVSFSLVLFAAIVYAYHHLNDYLDNKNAYAWIPSILGTPTDYWTGLMLLDTSIDPSCLAAPEGRARPTSQIVIFNVLYDRSVDRSRVFVFPALR